MNIVNAFKILSLLLDETSGCFELLDDVDCDAWRDVDGSESSTIVTLSCRFGIFRDMTSESEESESASNVMISVMSSSSEWRLEL